MKYLDEVVLLGTLCEDLEVVIRSLGGSDGEKIGECHIIGEIIRQVQQVSDTIAGEQREEIGG